jgi:2-keto-4-pentenoate hydratase/2-oxohepta-3-ene-1,7-dioic acid hydratase in catechol pathway
MLMRLGIIGLQAKGKMQEMKVLLGPAKGKDFATSIGPYLVTKDELEAYKIGDRFNLEMKASLNGKEITRGYFKDIHYTFGQMIERASEEVTLFPGDIIGSGTVGFGCIMEIGPEEIGWLEPGDIVELEISHLGKLRNKIV